MEKANAYFWIENFGFDHSEITRLLGLEPTSAWNKGDVVVWKKGDATKERARTFSTWAVHSPLPASDLLLDHHIEALLEMVEPREEVLTQLRRQGCEMGMNCVGEFVSNPGFHLAREIISRCASLGLSIDIDFYCLTD